MHYVRIMMISLTVFFMIAPSFALTDSHSRTIDIFKSSPQVRPFFRDSYGYADFPTVVKGAFTIGAGYGSGLVYHNDRITGKSSVYNLSIGLQIGGQVFQEIIFFQDKRAYDEFTSGEFEFDAKAAAVVITVGAQAKAGSEGLTAGASVGPATGVQAKTKYINGMATFVHAQGGLMYELSIGGQKFTFNPI